MVDNPARTCTCSDSNVLGMSDDHSTAPVDCIPAQPARVRVTGLSTPARERASELDHSVASIEKSKAKTTVSWSWRVDIYWSSLATICAVAVAPAAKIFL